MGSVLNRELHECFDESLLFGSTPSCHSFLEFPLYESGQWDGVDNHVQNSQTHGNGHRHNYLCVILRVLSHTVEDELLDVGTDGARGRNAS